MTGVVDLDGVRVEYDDVVAVEELSLTVRDGELFCLLGPSGCGKTTTLRTIAGFETPTAGRVALDGTAVTGRPPYERDCATVFQDWALFPNKSVLENVAFGPKMTGVSASERRERGRERLATVEMSEYADTRPSALSGGQKQRVALARALAVDPDVLLLDEPLSNLDKRLRETMQLEIKRIQERLETPMLYVTHDQDEAFTLADRIGIMNDGRLVQVGAPGAVYDDPVNRFVESFLGSTNFLKGRVVESATGGDREGRVDVEFPALDVVAGVPTARSLSAGDGVTASVRPETIDLAPATEGAASTDGGTASRPESEGEDDDAPGAVRLVGTVSEVVHRGSTVRQYVTVGDGVDLFVERPATRAANVAAGERVRLSWDASDCYYFGPDDRRVRV